VDGKKIVFDLLTYNLAFVSDKSRQNCSCCLPLPTGVLRDVVERSNPCRLADS